MEFFCARLFIYFFSHYFLDGQELVLHPLLFCTIIWTPLPRSFVAFCSLAFVFLSLVFQEGLDEPSEPDLYLSVRWKINSSI
jgi:hypothetical protein